MLKTKETMTNEMIQEKAENFADALSDGQYFKNSPLHKCRKHGFIQVAQWAKRRVIEKACEAFRAELKTLERLLIEYDPVAFTHWIDFEDNIEEFRKKLEE